MPDGQKDDIVVPFPVRYQFSLPFFKRLDPTSPRSYCLPNSNVISFTTADINPILQTDQYKIDVPRSHWAFLGDTEHFPMQYEEGKEDPQIMLLKENLPSSHHHLIKALIACRNMDIQKRVVQGGFIKIHAAVLPITLLKFGFVSKREDLIQTFNRYLPLHCDSTVGVAPGADSDELAITVSKATEVGTYTQHFLLQKTGEDQFTLHCQKTRLTIKQPYFDDVLLQGARTILSQLETEHSLENEDNLYALIPMLCDRTFADAFFEKITTLSVDMQKKALAYLPLCFDGDALRHLENQFETLRLLENTFHVLRLSEKKINDSHAFSMAYQALTQSLRLLPKTDPLSPSAKHILAALLTARENIAADKLPHLTTLLTRLKSDIEAPQNFSEASYQDALRHLYPVKSRLPRLFQFQEPALSSLQQFTDQLNRITAGPVPLKWAEETDLRINTLPEADQAIRCHLFRSLSPLDQENVMAAVRKITGPDTVPIAELRIPSQRMAPDEQTTQGCGLFIVRLETAIPDEKAEPNPAAHIVAVTQGATTRLFATQATISGWSNAALFAIAANHIDHFIKQQQAAGITVNTIDFTRKSAATDALVAMMAAYCESLTPQVAFNTIAGQAPAPSQIEEMASYIRDLPRPSTPLLHP